MIKTLRKQAFVVPMAAFIGLSATSMVQAADLTISVQNLTQGITFTPFLVAAHDDATKLYQVGMPASLSLQMMAEGGSIDALAADVMAAGGEVITNPHQNVLKPSESVAAFDFDTGSNTHLSITSMLLPTNDAFAGLNAWQIPTEAGTYVMHLSAYDAGTEANNELLVPGAGAPGALGIPADPTGMTGTGGTGVAMADTNTTIHIHRGALGDDDAMGGKSDLDNTVHRWLNPVLKVTVIVK